MKNVEFLRIESLLESIGLKQIAVEPSPDSELGFRMWGGKDALGIVTRWLAKNKPGLLFSLRLSSLSGNGTVVAKIDNNGNIIKESLTSADVPDHNELEGLQGGNSTERYHLTLVEKNNLHSPLALASNDGPLTLDAQTIGFLFGNSLQLVDGALQVNTANIDHGSFSGLNDDDHTQYVPVNAVRGFSAPVSGQVPTLGSHLTTKDYVDAMTSGSTDFQSSVKNFSDSIPVSPELGDRYIVDDADAWAPHPLQAIVEFDGTDWLDKWIPTQPGATGARVYVEDENVDYRFTGTVWQKVPQVTLHSELLNLQNDDHPQYPREDGSRGFSQPVPGQTPTSNAHLATKGYVDGQKDAAWDTVKNGSQVTDSIHFEDNGDGTGQIVLHSNAAKTMPTGNGTNGLAFPSAYWDEVNKVFVLGKRLANQRTTIMLPSGPSDSALIQSDSNSDDGTTVTFVLSDDGISQDKFRFVHIAPDGTIREMLKMGIDTPASETLPFMVVPGVFAVATKNTSNVEVFQGFRANSAATANKFWKLPAADGTDGQVLYTDGVGNLGWKDTSGGGGGYEIAYLVPASDASGVLNLCSFPSPRGSYLVTCQYALSGAVQRFVALVHMMTNYQVKVTILQRKGTAPSSFSAMYTNSTGYVRLRCLGMQASSQFTVDVVRLGAMQNIPIEMDAYTGDQSLTIEYQDLTTGVSTSKYASTLTPAGCTSNVAPESGSSNNWVAHATMLIPTDDTVLTANSSELAMICPQPVNGANYILAIYKYVGAGNPLTLVAASGVNTMPASSSWLLATITTVVENLTSGERYFAVLLWNGNGAQCAGVSGAALNVQPYLAFMKANLGNLSAAPSTLSVESERTNHLFIRVKA
jgi:hypothetical protein